MDGSVVIASTTFPRERLSPLDSIKRPCSVVEVDAVLGQVADADAVAAFVQILPPSPSALSGTNARQTVCEPFGAANDIPHID